MTLRIEDVKKGLDAQRKGGRIPGQAPVAIYGLPVQQPDKNFRDLQREKNNS
jgi:hypothetical protein